MNVLLVTLDQFRGDALSCAGHPVVQTPHLDALAQRGVRFAQHYSQATPCAPGRASLYTGQYQMNHRVVANGTPLRHGTDNIALMARRAGYEPALIGYTDTGVDPSVVEPSDPRLNTYEGVLEGFDAIADLAELARRWIASLELAGVDTTLGPEHLLATESDRPSAMSCSQFQTDLAIQWLEEREDPWFLHLSYLRPHPPYAAPSEWSTMYDAVAMSPPIEALPAHLLHELALGVPQAAAPNTTAGLDHLRRQYFAMITHIDDQVGQLVSWLDRSGDIDDTFILVTSDHGEQLGDHGLVEKLGYFSQSYHIPAIVFDPRRAATHASVVERFTENVDIAPTLCEVMGIDVPLACDGVSLLPFLDGIEPNSWRTAVHWEYDWSDLVIRMGANVQTPERDLESHRLVVRRDHEHSLVVFGDGTWLCFDLLADPGERVLCDDADQVAALLADLHAWRMRHLDRRLTRVLLDDPPLHTGLAS